MPTTEVSELQCESASKPWPKPLNAAIHVARHKHGSVDSGAVLCQLFSRWTERKLKEDQHSIMYATSSERAANDLRRFLQHMAEPTHHALKSAVKRAIDWQIRQKFASAQQEYDDAVRGYAIDLDECAMSTLRDELGAWSQVEGLDVMRVLLGGSDEDDNRIMATLEICPNSAFVWTLVFGSLGYGYWPLSPSSFEQQLSWLHTNFINECLNDFRHPLPIMELADLFKKHQPSADIAEETMHMSLTPPELAYAISYGALLLDVCPDGEPPGPKNRPRIKVNPLFC